LRFNLGKRVVGLSKARRIFCFAGFAASGCVAELLIVEEALFPGGKEELLTAINAFEALILKFH
jgi:hypothetical protein